MKTTYQFCAMLVALVGSGHVSASWTVQPVEYYISSGVEIPEVPGPTPQSASSTPTPSSTASVTPVPQPKQEKQFSTSGHPTAGPISHTTVAMVTQTLSSESKEANTLPTATIQATTLTTAPVIEASGAGVMTIAITNNWPTPLSISYMNNPDSPSAIGAPQGAPLGSQTTVIYPTGWGGRIYIGQTANTDSSLIEGSTTGANDVDVSYVDGFSVPITCSVNDTSFTGCNINLWAVSGTCANNIGDQNVCINPMQMVPNGPADPWFLPCQGAAYTFPNDNSANKASITSPNISCCIGTAAQGCAAPARQGKGDDLPSMAKRSLSEGLKAGAPSLLPHAHSHLRRHLVKGSLHGHRLV